MKRARVVIFLAGVAILIAITVRAGMTPVLEALANLQFSGLAAITLLHIPVILLMGVAWWFIGHAVTGARLGSFLAARLARDAVSEALPFSQLGGFVGGLRLLVLSGSRALHASLAMLADLLIEFLAKLFYTLAGLLVLAWLLPDARLIRPFALALAAAFLAFGLLALFRKPLRTLLRRLVLWALRKWAPADSYTDADITQTFRATHALPSFLVHALCWFLGAVEAWVTLRLMGIGVSGSQALVIDSLGTAFRALGFLVPAALGVQEAGYVIVCGLFGLSPATAIAFSLARRGRDLLIGVAGLGLWQALEIRKAATAGE